MYNKYTEMIAENFDKMDTKNIFIMQPIKNTLINHGLFYKLLYSNNLFTLNGIYIKFKLDDINFLNGRLFYNMNINNIDIINKLEAIEKFLLEKINIDKNIDKKIYFKIKDQIKSGNIKLNIYIPDIILKISGIWENENSIGLSYKIFPAVNNINL